MVKKRKSANLQVLEASRKRKEKRQLEREEWENSDSDEIYAYIAGYTAWGFPYGLTWEEMEQIADFDSLCATTPPPPHKPEPSTAVPENW
ncbi:hypothetical protein SAMN02799630_06019 [Paenibacillus sp. UNCCL117]|nr:hypothetical protein SAMN04488602_13821 [Paenibacillus sp. cl123]SFW70509.1 hypothetical protein SAMN02799630_06019 [Paenibacillus sp. UNCCL117]